MLLGVFGCFCAQSGGQAPPSNPATPGPAAPSDPEMSSHEAPVTFSSRVNLVSVPVVVRDREGRALGNFRQEDFQLFDKGKLQVITKFSVDRSSEKPSSAVQVSSSTTLGIPTPAAPVPAKHTLPERYVAYLFDDVHLERSDLLQARQAVNRHLDESLEPTTRAAIFTTSGLMLAEFTDDREKLHKAVNSILPWSSGPDPQQDCPPMTYYMADLLVNKLMYLSGFLYTDEQLAALVGKGQVDRALTAEMEEGAACGAANTEPVVINLIRQVRIVARQVLTSGDRETNFALGAVEDVVRRISAMPGNRTIVLVSPGFLLTQDHRSHEYDALDRAIRANVTVNTIDIRGLYTTVPGGDASHRGYGSAGGYLSQAGISAANDAQNVLGELADGTGGRFFHNDNGLKEGLNLLAARPEFVYVLGFSPQNLKFDGSYHNLKVTLRNASGLTLQVRRGYWAPKHAVDPAEEAQDEIREVVFSRDEIHDIPVDVQTEFFKPGESTAELTVASHLDANALRFRRAEDRNTDTLTVVTGLFDPNGNYVAGIERLVELHLKDHTLEAMRNAGISVKESFKVAPGRYLVRVVVRDQEGNTMAARNRSVEIP
jgi:VWFA-related protein